MSGKGSASEWSQILTNQRNFKTNNIGIEICHYLGMKHLQFCDCNENACPGSGAPRWHQQQAATSYDDNARSFWTNTIWPNLFAVLLEFLMTRPAPLSSSLLTTHYRQHLLKGSLDSCDRKCRLWPTLLLHHSSSSWLAPRTSRTECWSWIQADPDSLTHKPECDISFHHDSRT